MRFTSHDRTASRCETSQQAASAAGQGRASRERDVECFRMPTNTPQSCEGRAAEETPSTAKDTGHLKQDKRRLDRHSCASRKKSCVCLFPHLCWQSAPFATVGPFVLEPSFITRRARRSLDLSSGCAKPRSRPEQPCRSRQSLTGDGLFECKPQAAAMPRGTRSEDEGQGSPCARPPGETTSSCQHGASLQSTQSCLAKGTARPFPTWKFE